MVNFYFVCSNKLEVDLCEQCGVKHILVSYAFATKVMKDKSLAWMRDKFETILIDSGAHTAFTQGKEVDFDKYSDFLKKERENYTYCAQLDIIGDTQRTIDNYIRHTKEGTDWVMPIVTANWPVHLAKLEKYLVTDYIAIGGSQWWKRFSKDNWNVVRSLPRKYHYHGFAKGQLEAFRHNWIYSIDSSTWSFGARARQSQAWVRGKQLGLNFGRRGTHDRQDVRRTCEVLKNDLEACKCKVSDYVDGDYKTLLTAGIVLFYRPMFRQFKIFEKNFYF